MILWIDIPFEFSDGRAITITAVDYHDGEVRDFDFEWTIEKIANDDAERILRWLNWPATIDRYIKEK